MDALVAYLQILGRMVDFTADSHRRPAAVAGGAVDTILPMLKQFWVVWLMVLFVGIVAWVYWPSRQQADGRRRAHPVPG